MMSWIEKYRALKKQFWKNIEEAYGYNCYCGSYIQDDLLWWDCTPVFTITYRTPPTAPEHMEEVEDAWDDEKQEKKE